MRYRVYERYDYDDGYGYDYTGAEGIAGAIYLLVGILIAVSYDYFDHLSTLARLLEAMLAVLLWPLLLLGVHINIA